MSSIIGIAVDWFGTPFTHQVAFQHCSWIACRPSRQSISYGRDVFADTIENLTVRVRQEQPLECDPILDGLDNLRYNSFRRPVAQ